jgi:hypothetical protein
MYIDSKDFDINWVANGYFTQVDPYDPLIHNLL